MDRRTLLAMFLCISIYYGWLVLRGPLEIPEEVDLVEQQVPPAPVPAPVPEPAPEDEPAPPLRDVPFRACEASGTWSTDGGVLRDLVLVDQEEPYEVTTLWAWLGGLVTGSGDAAWRPYGDAPGPARLLSPDALALSAGAGPLRQPAVRMEVVDDSPAGVSFRGRTRDGIEITKRIGAATEDPCVLQAEITWRNVGTAPFQGDIWLGAHDRLPTDGGGMLARYSSIGQALAMVDGSVIYGDISDLQEPEAQPGPVSWFGLADRYFGLVILPEDRSGTAFLSPRPTAGGDTVYGHQYVLPVEALAPGASHTASFRIFLGPLETDVLRAVEPDLARIVDFGWFAFFAHPLLWLLKVFHAGVGNWGLAIMLLTLLVKMIFFPLTQTAFKSGQAMQAIQPRLQELREQYKDNQEELNRRMMELFRENGVNPLGGCLPMLIQFPVWIALYNVLLSSVELYHTEFLYLRDLSSPDPYGVLPLIVVGLMVVQQSLTPMGNLDPAQARVMKLMPLVFGVFFFTFPSGLVVYIFVNMVLSILQQWLIKRAFTLPAAGAPA